MKGTRLLGFLLLAAAAAALAAGFLVYRDRLEKGDLYPPYSSLRADPLGTKALHEALREIPGLQVKRHLASPQKLDATSPATFLFLGCSSEEWMTVERSWIDAWERLAREGHRVVIGFYRPAPSLAGAFRNVQQEVRSSASKESNTRWTDLSSAWSFTSKARPWVYPLQPKEARKAGEIPELPDTWSVHTPLVFLPEDQGGWRTIYALEEGAAMMERRLGKGSIVVVSDSYTFSNESLFWDPAPALIAWLLGWGQTVVFDEHHLGTKSHRGVAALIREFRLQGIAAALCVAVLLFLWRETVPLVPGGGQAPETGAELGRDAQSGFIELLRRNVPARGLLPVAFEAWRGSLPRGRVTAARLREVESLVEAHAATPAKSRNLLEDYRRIARVLNQKS
jgi:hypothetical protein